MRANHWGPSARCLRWGGSQRATRSRNHEEVPLSDARDQTVHEAELAGFLERLLEPLMTKALSDRLHAKVRALKRLVRLVGPAGVAQKLPERELGLPALNWVAY